MILTKAIYNVTTANETLKAIVVETVGEFDVSDWSVLFYVNGEFVEEQNALKAFKVANELAVAFITLGDN